MDYWRSKNERQIECPYCRRTIKFIVIFDESVVNQENLDNIRRFNTYFSDDRSVISSFFRLKYDYSFPIE